MLKNYFKIAFRSLLRNKLHTGINILGLAIGISACFTIYQIVKYENSFDTFHPDRDRIYRVYTQFSGMFDGTNPGVSMPLAPALDANATGLELVAPIHSLYETNVSFNNSNGTPKTLNDQKNVAFVSPSYFHIFSSYQWLNSSPEIALSNPYQVVLTKERAKHYFGVDDPNSIIGKEIIYQDSLPVTVSGIVATLEGNTDLNPTDFISYTTIENSWYGKTTALEEWRSFYGNQQLFIKTTTGTAEPDVETQMDQLLAQNSEGDNSGWTVNFKLQPLSELHFNGELGLLTDDGTTAHRPTLYALLIIAGILLLIASFNFINLTTAQSMQRSKEVGVRKVLGGNKRSLVTQFLSETFLLTLFAGLLSILFTQWSFQYFSGYLPDGIQFQFLQPEMLLFLFATIVVVSLLSGFYPAFVLSSFLPVRALKKQLAGNPKNSSSNWIRKGLIVLQFGISLVLIASTFFVAQQINFMMNKDLGFNKDSIVHFRVSWKQPKELKTRLYNELSNVTGVEGISLSSAPPSSGGSMSSNFSFDVNGEKQSHHIQRKVIDESYMDVYDLKLVAGRTMIPSDTMRELMINEEMVKLMGLSSPEEAIGKSLEWSRGRQYPIVGVINDFHQNSLKFDIAPIVLNNANNGLCFNLKLNNADVNNTLDRISAVWNEVYPGLSFNYNFLDESIARYYETERRTAKLVQSATVIAIFISCIGLFGLVSFAVERRSREIGIRKVLGASVAGIVSLISKDFLKLVGIAFFLAIPVSYWLLQDWLSDFAYQISIQWWVYALSGVIAMGISFLTISFRSIRAALANPVDALRNE